MGTLYFICMPLKQPGSELMSSQGIWGSFNLGQHSIHVSLGLYSQTQISACWHHPFLQTHA